MLSTAAAAFPQWGMSLYEAAAIRHRGRRLGGKTGQELVRSADATMAAQGIVRPDRVAAALLPGFEAGTTARSDET